MTTPKPLTVEDTPAMLYSLAEYMPVLLPLFTHPLIRSVCEIGAERGDFTAALAEHLAPGHIDRITVVDPVLSACVLKLSADPRIHLVEMPSLSALVDLRAHDLYAIDGDHNHHTVLNELRLIHAANRNAIILVHDVGWPCGRRDHYYAPGRLPAHAVHPHSFTCAISINNPGCSSSGMTSQGNYAVALHEGGKRNGVLTAVDDFLTDRHELGCVALPIFHGLGIIYPTAHPLADVITRTVMPGAPWMEILRRLEANRIRNWLALINAQKRQANTQTATKEDRP